MQIELNYDCRANPSAVGHVIKFEADLGEDLDASLNPKWSQNEYQILIKMEAKMDAVRQKSSDVKNWKLES